MKRARRAERSSSRAGHAAAATPGYPAVDQALEAIAGSLNLIHQLAQAPAAAAPHGNAAFAGTVAMAPGQAAPPTQPSPQGWGQQPPQPAYQQPAAPAYQQQPPRVPAAARLPAAAARLPAAAARAGLPAARARLSAAAPRPLPRFRNTPARAAAAGGAAIRIEAELGAHSTTNFYKGLSGNDVIDSGGIFVATYQIPKIGSNVVVKVSMPGGYEFEAAGHRALDARGAAVRL